MKKQSHSSKSILYSQATATVSVTLVLLMLGIILLSGIAARTMALSLKDEVGFTVVIADTVSSNQIQAIGNRLQEEPAVNSLEFVSAEKVLDRWNSMLGGLNDSIFDSNPFLPEWHAKVNDAWISADSLQAVTNKIKQWPGVEDATFFSDMAETVDSTFRMLTLLLSILAGVLTLISFVLISNTVRLAVHSRRLSIHAMQLVGAKGGFIRRPFILSAILSALIAASAASVVCIGAIVYISTIYPPIYTLLDATSLAVVFGALYVLGVVICALAALFATNRYLYRDYDDLFN